MSLVTRVAAASDRLADVLAPRIPESSGLGRAMRAVRHRVLPRTVPDRPIAAVLHAFGRANPDAFFVQVGAHDGTQLDPLRDQIRARRWSGIMVEPVPYVFERLQANYGAHPRIALENIAIADRDGTLPFHHLPEADAGDDTWRWYDALGSFRRDVLLSHERQIPDIADRVVTSEVPCLTFERLCAKHGVEVIDVVQIDTEGYDDVVLDGIDLVRHRPGVVLFERLHLDEATHRRCTDRLVAHGYEWISDPMDTLAVRADVLRSQPAVAEAWREATESWRRHTASDDEPLPPEADELHADNPRLRELVAAYEALDWPVRAHSRWAADPFERLDLQRFRGDTGYVWSYREQPRVTELKYFTYLRAVEEIDHLGLLDRLTEDGLFGCWTQQFPGHPRCSRDLLDSVNELSFLDRHLSVSTRDGLRVLDIGAGYGRLAHRATTAFPGIADHCCVDAVAHSTFLAEWYLAHRGVDRARALPLPEVPELAPGSFDLALNVHSFSECTLDAIGWWSEQLDRLAVPHLFVVPNEPAGFLSLEADGSRHDFLPVLEDAGYRLTVDEPVFADPAVRSLLGVHDRHCLFERAR